MHQTMPYNSLKPVALFRFVSPIAALLLLAFLSPVLLAPLVQAELATDAEMEQVCRNWMMQHVYERGVWAGDTDPDIVQVDEITSGDTLLARVYTISSGGFVVVPTLKEMVPVKAYSDESALDDLQEGGFLLLLRESLSSRMSLFAKEYGSLEAVQPAIGPALFGHGQRLVWDQMTKSSDEFLNDLALRKSVKDVEAGPLLTSSWHQGAPYNDLCPMGDGGRTVVGCVATALVQIMNFWQWPPSGIGSYAYTWDGDNSCEGIPVSEYLSADFSDAYDWDNIIDSCDGGCTAAQEAALAELSYEVGVAFAMDYGFCGSGASVGRAVNILPEFFKYSQSVTRVDRNDYTLTEWFDLIREEVDNGRPAQYRINLHSIVADGYRQSGELYEYHMNYGWGGNFNAWFVLDSLYCGWIEGDICPADEEFMITHIVPQTEPVLSVLGFSVDGNGYAQPGETVELSMTVQNDGWDAGSVSGNLVTNDPFITFGTAEATFGSPILWGEQAGSDAPFVFTIDAGCPDPHIAVFELVLSADGGYQTTDSVLLFVGNQRGFSDEMESGEGFWRHRSVLQAYSDEWHLSTARAFSGSSSWKSGSQGLGDYVDLSDGGLMTPPFLLPANARLTFEHWIDAEVGTGSTAWDGGILMIAGTDGQWSQIHPVGGYPYTIIDNPASSFAPGTPCYSGTVDWSTETFDLSAYSGVVQLMFRFGTDGATTQEGWYVDNVEVFQNGDCCTGPSVGNVDESVDNLVTMGDLTVLIDHLFIALEPLACVTEGNVDMSADGLVTMGDLTVLISHLFITLDPLPACP